MRRIEVYGIHQQTIEQRTHARIHECNDRIRKNTETYNDWDHADERLKANYTKEEYKHQFIDYWREERRRLVNDLQMVRQGYILE